MRIALFLLLSLIFFQSNAQLLDPTKDWFRLKDYFNEEVIKERAIIQLDILISSKADGKAIEEFGEKLSYYYNASGRLTMAKKRIPMYRGFDTSWVEIQYDDQGRRCRSIERHGPYHYEYVFQFNADTSFNSIKLRPSKEGFDTLYFRHHHIVRKDGEEFEKVSNRKGVVFLTKKRKYNEEKRTSEERMEYVFSKNQSTTSYAYDNGTLIRKNYQMDYGQKSNSQWEFDYKDGIIQEVRISEKGQLSKRIAFTFSDGLPSAAVMRVFEEKEIKIYRFKYTFY